MDVEQRADAVESRDDFEDSSRISPRRSRQDGILPTTRRLRIFSQLRQLGLPTWMATSATAERKAQPLRAGG
jgi:hypothetical protein